MRDCHSVVKTDGYSVYGHSRKKTPEQLSNIDAFSALSVVLTLHEKTKINTKIFLNANHVYNIVYYVLYLVHRNV